MKKGLLVASLSLLLLAGCSKAKNNTKQSLDSSSTIANTLSVLEEKPDESLHTKKIEFKTGEDGVQQTQYLTYKGKAYIKLVTEQISPLKDDLKNAVNQVGIEETTRLLKEATEKDENYKQALTLPGFTNNIEILPDQRLKVTSEFDLQKINTDEMDKMPYFKGSNLKDVLDMEPAKYIEARQYSGATITDVPSQ